MRWVLFGNQRRTWDCSTPQSVFFSYYPVPSCRVYRRVASVSGMPVCLFCLLAFLTVGAGCFKSRRHYPNPFPNPSPHSNSNPNPTGRRLRVVLSYTCIKGVLSLSLSPPPPLPPLIFCLESSHSYGYGGTMHAAVLRRTLYCVMLAFVYFLWGREQQSYMVVTPTVLRCLLQLFAGCCVPLHLVLRLLVSLRVFGDLCLYQYIVASLFLDEGPIKYYSGNNDCFTFFV